MNDDTITISPGPRFYAAMALAVAADALQIVVFPQFVEGAFSPAAKKSIFDLPTGSPPSTAIR